MNVRLAAIAAILVLVTIVIIVLMSRQNQSTSSTKAPVHERVKTSIARNNLKPSSGKQISNGSRFKAEASCPISSDIITANVSLNSPTYTFTCDAEVNIHEIKVSKTIYFFPGAETDPFESLTLLPVSSDITCPEPEEDADPLMTGIIPVDTEFQVPGSLLILKNTSKLSTNATPGSTVDPWYVEKEPYSTSNKTVVTIGCREVFAGGEGTDADRRNPIIKGRGTGYSIIDITFDQSVITDPVISEIDLEIAYGVSVEIGYDYFSIATDTKRFVNISAMGADENQPYITGTVKIRVKLTDTVHIQFLKDYIWYGGVDSCYFRVVSVNPVKPVEFPGKLQVFRGSMLIQTYSQDFDEPTFEGANVDCQLSLQTGDQLSLTVDSNVYESYDVTLSLQTIPQILDHKNSETFSAQVDMNTISHGQLVPQSVAIPTGWYETNLQTGALIVFFEEVKACGSYAGGLIGKNYSCTSSASNYLNEYRSYPAIKLDRISSTRYKNPLTLIEYDFNPVTGEFKIDYLTTNFPSYDLEYMRPIRNADEKYWKYQFSLQDYNHQFNTPLKFYDFVVDYFKSGLISSNFAMRSYPYFPEINPLNLDRTQCKASFGVVSAAEYDDLARQLRDFGVERKYKIQRFVYWPYPGAGQPILSALQKKELRWHVNHNRYPFLAIVLKLDNEYGKNYAKLMPGESVTLSGTGTRLDGMPLRLAIDGYHTGPKPTREFMQTYSGVDPRTGKVIPRDRSYDIFNEWSYYTLRLPITIDSTNNTIRSRAPQFLAVTSTPNLDLGPYNFIISAENPVTPITGKLVPAVPLDAATPITNGSALAGNIALIIRGGVNFATKIQNAQAAGAIGVIIYNSSTGSPIGGFFGGGTIPAIMLPNYDDGNELFTAIQGGAIVNVNVVNPPIMTQTIPMGTYYFSELFDLLHNKYMKGESEFFLDPGLYSGEDSSDFVDSNGSVLALAGTTGSNLFGPNDPVNPSNFFGPTGMDIGYLWDTPGSPIPAFGYTTIEETGERIGTYTQLFAGEYKTHTPLTSTEAQALINAASSLSASVYSKHGPIRADMPYDNYAACINELSMARGTEDHAIISPWSKPIDNGLSSYHMSFDELNERLRLIKLDPTKSYTTSDTKVFAPILYSSVMRATGIGHSGEFSEMYMAGAYRSLLQDSSSGNGRMEWNIPRELFYYPYDTIVPNVGNVSFREVEITVVNYLRNPQWLAARPRTTAPIGAPDYYFIPYDQHTGQYATVKPGQVFQGTGFMTGSDVLTVTAVTSGTVYVGQTITGQPITGPDVLPGTKITEYLSGSGLSGTYRVNTPQAFDEGSIIGTFGVATAKEAVAGEWLVGVVDEDRSREILNLSSSSPVPGIGYITWHATSFSTDGDSMLYEWFDPNTYIVNPAGIAAVARILQYFNSQNVKHIIIDVRNTQGGSDAIWGAFASLVGGKRYFNESQSLGIQSLEPSGSIAINDTTTRAVHMEEIGQRPYTVYNTALDCDPQLFINKGLLNVIPNGIWNGEVTGQAAQGKTSNILWLSNSTTISATQAAYLRMKGTSLDGTEYDGDFGKSTRFVGVGVYNRPFSTGGGFESYLNWWTKGRKGEEDVPNGLMFGLDRFEVARGCYLDQQVNGAGGILKGLDQDFTRFHQPQIKWDMNADVFFQDIGYTIPTIFTGNMSGPKPTNILKVTSMTSGTILVGQTITGAGIADETIIEGYQSGTGGTGYYRVNIAQNFGSTTITVPGVQPQTDGEPWLPSRYAEVDFNNPLTYRDTAFERCIQMAVDPDLESHFYVEDGYGYLSSI